MNKLIKGSQGELAAVIRDLPGEFILAAKIHCFLPIFSGLRGKAGNDVSDNGQPLHPLLKKVHHPAELGHCVFPPHVPKHGITSCLQEHFIEICVKEYFKTLTVPILLFGQSHDEYTCTGT